jgi:hypothetical protein
MRVDQSTQLAAERLRLLAEQVADEIGRVHGWKTAVAQRLGVSPSLLSHVLEHRRGVGQSTVQSVCRRLGLDGAWFMDRSLRSRDYHAYLRSNPSHDDGDAPAFREFLHGTELGRQLSAGEHVGPERARALLAQLRRVDLAGLPGIDAGCYEEMARRAVLALLSSTSAPPRG